MNVNRVFIGGNITADPEIKTTQSGIGVCQFTVAVNRYSKGGKVTEFVNCKAFDKQADLLIRHFHKGNTIYVEGRLETSSWKTDAGETRYKTEVIVNDVQFFGTKTEMEAEAAAASGGAPVVTANPGKPNGGNAQGNMFSAPMDAVEAELPF